MTRKISLLALLTFAAATTLLGHAGEVHSYMGTITAAGGDGSYTMKTTKAESVSFVVSKKTSLRFADNSPAKESDLAPGVRVVVEISKDGKTATSIKLARR